MGQTGPFWIHFDGFSPLESTAAHEIRKMRPKRDKLAILATN